VGFNKHSGQTSAPKLPSRQGPSITPAVGWHICTALFDRHSAVPLNDDKDSLIQVTRKAEGEDEDEDGVFSPPCAAFNSAISHHTQWLSHKAKCFLVWPRVGVPLETHCRSCREAPSRIVTQSDSTQKYSAMKPLVTDQPLG
jgi:hypothetical protein